MRKQRKVEKKIESEDIISEKLLNSLAIAKTQAKKQTKE